MKNKSKTIGNLQIEPQLYSDDEHEHDNGENYNTVQYSARSQKTDRSNFTFKTEMLTDQQKSKECCPCLPAIKRMIEQLIQLLLFDIMFCLFIISQEVADQSNLSLIILDAQFSKKSRVQAAIISQVAMNAVVILTSYLISGIFLSQNQANFISVFILYFIVAFEMLTHILP